MNFFFVHILGKWGVVVAIGVLIYLYSYKNSIKLFDWIETQTTGTREYILSKCQLMFVEVDPQKLTYGLLFAAFGVSAIVFAIFSLFGQFYLGGFLAAILCVVGWKTPRMVVDMMVEKRIEKYKIQMVDGLNLLSNGIRAGLSLPQSLDMVVRELPAPISQEFDYILQQNRIGVQLDEAFEVLVKRVPTEDNEMFVTSVNILRETGGNLAEVFDTITAVIRERVRLGQKIDTFVAQGKFQGYTIAAMPLVMMGLFGSSDPQSIELMFTHPLGLVMLFVAFSLDAIGLFIILKITKIKV